MKFINLTNGLVAIVDDDDFDWLDQFKWYAKKERVDRENYYAAMTVRKNGKVTNVFMHRLITKCPRDKVVHHKSNDGLDNRRENLEICDQSKNLSERWNNKKNNCVTETQGNGVGRRHDRKDA